MTGTTDLKLSEAPGSLQSKFENTEVSEHGSKWNELWLEKCTPWDRGLPHPALEDLLKDRKDLIGDSWIVDPTVGKRRKRALVPGSGRGYDVVLLSAFGYDAYGLDVSDVALAAAKETEENRGNNEVYRMRDSADGVGKITWLVGDFFGDEFLKAVDGDGTFELIWDYTFLSALPPTLRPAWAFRYNQFLAPKGHLVCGEWPTLKNPNSGGPPWALPPKVYTAHLPRPGREIVYDQEGALEEENLGPESNDGLQRVEHFKPKRTHVAGIVDGKPTDFIGVWKHKVVA